MAIVICHVQVNHLQASPRQPVRRRRRSTHSAAMVSNDTPSSSHSSLLNYRQMQCGIVGTRSGYTSPSLAHKHRLDRSVNNSIRKTSRPVARATPFGETGERSRSLDSTSRTSRLFKSDPNKDSRPYCATLSHNRFLITASTLLDRLRSTFIVKNDAAVVAAHLAW